MSLHSLTARRVAVVCTVVVPCACGLVVPLERLTLPAEAGADEAGLSEASVAPGPCAPRLPGRPDPPTPPGELSLSFVLSYVSFAENASDAGAELCEVNGFNIDEKTTCQNENGEFSSDPCPGDLGCSSSCTSVATTGQSLCDLAGGIDNGLGRLLAQRGAFLTAQIGSLDLQSVVKSGNANVIIQVGGYNGAADDDEVFVLFILSSGLEERTSLAGPRAFDAGPAWDGKSLRRWAAHPASVGAGGIPKAKPSAGYVNNHILTVPMSAMLIPLGPVLVQVNETRMTAELRQRVDDRWELVRGRIGGRLSSRALIAAVAKAPFSTGDKTIHLCEREQQLSTARDLICSQVDLAPGDSDGGDCADLSMGLGFTAVPGLMGDLREPEEGPLGCPDADLGGCP